MPVDSSRARTERALAELVATEGPRAVTVARVRAAARVDQTVAADVVREWRTATQRVGATDKVAQPATEDETRAFEALRATIHQAVLSERAGQDEAVNQAASAAAEEADQARQEAARLAEELDREKGTTAEHVARIATLEAELATVTLELGRLREELDRTREAASVAREEAAEARGKLFVYEQQAQAASAPSPEPSAPAKPRARARTPKTTTGEE